MDEVARVLSRARFIADVKTDRALAEFLKISCKTLDGWKTRKSIPFRRIAEMAHALGVSFEYLAGGRAENTPEKNTGKRHAVALEELQAAAALMRAIRAFCKAGDEEAAKRTCVALHKALLFYLD